ncbi:hypothetical protein FB567DRAFT_438163, partial [Paraphoma chrysanthemicola]
LHPDTFNGSFLDPDPTAYDASQPLLTDLETQSIADFFTNTDPFHLSDPHAFAPAADTKDTIDGFSDWPNFVTPATVHGVSTTIPDQSHLHTNFFNDNTFAQQPLHPNHYGNTHDDLQAAETLFNNSQNTYNNNNNNNNHRSHSFQGLPSSSQAPPTTNAPIFDQNGKPFVLTPHGLINEQLAALLPKYGEEGTIDAQLAAQWAASDDEQSEDATSDEDEDDQPSRKRRKSSNGKSSQKRARHAKARKVSAVEESSKKKRGSAAQKAQRENLTEEQKRSNHILSEQKRRNLIKRGFDELHDLVPEIRNGGLSKSSVLTEAANFLEKLIEENIAFRQLAGG